MTHVITQNCINDASCVPVCPVNCIHPAPDEPGYGTTQMLYIDPNVCIDCGACVSVCPVSAIKPDYELGADEARYEGLNALYYTDSANADYNPTPIDVKRRLWSAEADEVLRVAIVGSGPAAAYAAEDLLAQRGLKVSIDMFEKLSTPWGLIRYGVAPDHQSTKKASAGFEKLLRNPAFRILFNVEVGKDVSHEDLAKRYHAIIYAAGAPISRPIEISGGELPGSHSAGDFVAWYNGHPDHANDTFDLTSERAVIIGNGNVALDVARILLSDHARLARTDIADHALKALAESRIREVVVVGRRSAAHAAFTIPELIGLLDIPGIGIRVDGPTGVALDDSADRSWSNSAVDYKLRLLDEASERGTAERTLIFRFLSAPVEIVGASKVEGITFARNEVVAADMTEIVVSTAEPETIETGLVFSAIGFRAVEISGLPFDRVLGIVPNVMGRLVDPDSGDPVSGSYATGWMQRGPSGVIGTNKHGARETVRLLLEDWEAGTLNQPTETDDISLKLPQQVGAEGWKRIDIAERQAGKATSRPRVKTVDAAAMIALARDE